MCVCVCVVDDPCKRPSKRTPGRAERRLATEAARSGFRLLHFWTDRGADGSWFWLLAGVRATPTCRPLTSTGS